MGGKAKQAQRVKGNLKVSNVNSVNMKILLDSYYFSLLQVKKHFIRYISNNQVRIYL
jgi:hypothetical protein